MTPLVSVIIPTYNHGDYVVQSVESVLDQKFKDYEIIVINDGSTDNTTDVLKPFIEKKQIIYIEQKNGGQGAARNCGISNSVGSFIAFLDDDDIWPIDKLEWQMKVMLENPDIAVIGGSAETIDYSGKVVGELPLVEGINKFEDLFCGNPFISPGQTLIRAEVLNDVGGLNESVPGADDLDLWIKIAKKSKIVSCNKVSLQYRVHSSNASKNDGVMFSNCLSVIKLHLDDVPYKNYRKCRTNAFRWLYSYVGMKFIEVLREPLKPDRRLQLRAIKYLLVFFVPAIKDPVLFRSLMDDIFVVKLKSRIKMVLK